MKTQLPGVAPAPVLPRTRAQMRERGWDELDILLVTGAYLGSATVGVEGEPAFTKDNRKILFAGSDGSLLTWTLDPRSWLATACRLAGRSLTEQEWRTYVPDRPFVPVCSS